VQGAEGGGARAHRGHRHGQSGQPEGGADNLPKGAHGGAHRPSEIWGAMDEEVLLYHLCEGGRGGRLERITPEDTDYPTRTFLHRALQAGALPSLKAINIALGIKTHRDSLMGGLVARVRELSVSINCTGVGASPEPQLAALGLVGQLPALTKLQLKVFSEEDSPVPQWTPFVPPSLKALTIEMAMHPTDQALVHALPEMLEASGAGLDYLEMFIYDDFKAIGDGLVHLAQAVRYCSPTLEAIVLIDAQHGNYEIAEVDDERERDLCLQRAALLAGVSACRGLRMLELPRFGVEPLFPPATAFGRLCHIEMTDFRCKHAHEAGMVGLWELMASQGLPVLAKLSVKLEGRWGGAGEMRTRVAPALEAVAGTLTHLGLTEEDGDWVGVEVDVGYELGVAVGKLQRLRELALEVFAGGRAYSAFSQGLAVSGGARPLPLVWKVAVTVRTQSTSYLVTSLLLPSVRVFRLTSPFDDSRATLLFACALRQAGYKHTFYLDSDTGRPRLDEVVGIASSVARCTVYIASDS
jgi:hypothetical protein